MLLAVLDRVGEGVAVDQGQQTPAAHRVHPTQQI